MIKGKFAKFTMIGIKITTGLLFSVLARTQECSFYPSGQFEIEKGHLWGFLSAIVNHDEMTIYDSDKIDLEMKDLSTGKKVNFVSKLKAIPVARSKDFATFVMMGIKENINKLFLVNTKGEVIDIIQAPAIFDVFDYTISEDGKYLIAANSKVIYQYHFVQKTWKQLYSTEGKAKQLYIFSNQDKLLNYVMSKDSLLFREYGLYKGNSNQNLFTTHVLDLKSGNIVFEYEEKSEEVLFFGNSRLAQLDSDSISLLNMDTRRIVKVNLTIDESKDVKKLIIGPNNSIGVGFQKANKVSYYNFKGELTKTIRVPKYISISSVSDGTKVFLSLERTKKYVLFDIQSSSFTYFPKILLADKLSSSGNLEILNNKIHFPIYDSINEQSYWANMDLSSKCWNRNDLMTAMLNKSVIGANQSIPLATLLAFEESDSILSSNEVRDILGKQLYDKELTTVLLSLSIMIIREASELSNSWRSYLALLKNSLFQIEDSRKEILINTMAIKITERLVNLAELNHVPQTKLANILIELIKPNLGLTSNPRTDFALVQDKEVMQPIILGTHPIDEDKNENIKYGIYYKKLKPFKVKLGDRTNIDFQWNHADKKWHAKGVASGISVSQFIKKKDSIDYSSLWKDKKLVGAMILSSNLHSDFENTARLMIDYFVKEGFSFGIPRVKFADREQSVWYKLRHIYTFPAIYMKTSEPVSWLKNAVETGELDYWVKEAHSAGSDDVIWLANRSVILKGEKKLSDDSSEVIYILLPERKNELNMSESTAVTTEQYGQWLRNREKNSGGEMVYLNASCWSSSRARQEIIAARTTILTELPTISSSWTFLNKTSNHERQLIHLLRSRKTFSEMKSELDKIGESENPFIFPNEKKYDDEIWNGLHSAIDYSFKIVEVSQ